MYRYSVDNAVTYSAEDFVLFRESPFACWMERLSLENPDHGIPTDVGSVAPGQSAERQDDLADTLRAEGKDVRLIDWEADEVERRSTTLDAMRSGADFIVNGQLALGPLSGVANLLVRTSGYSELGDFLYIPCDTQSKSNLNSAFHLCFLADLLHSLQGQLPPQMLIIRGGNDLVPLQTEDHIYHYRAVKQRLMEAMRGFRKHRMPDPAESSHFGRWSDCAHEVLKQRMLREDGREIADADNAFVQPLRKAVGSVIGSAAGIYDLDDNPAAGERRASAGAAGRSTATVESSSARRSGTPVVTLTLVEEARLLAPGAYQPGPGVFRIGKPVERSGPRLAASQERNQESANAAVPDSVVSLATDIQHPSRASELDPRASEAGPTTVSSSIGDPAMAVDSTPMANLPTASTAPAPSLRNPRLRSLERDNPKALPEPEFGKFVPWSMQRVEDQRHQPLQGRPEPPLSDQTDSRRSPVSVDEIVRPTPPTGTAFDMDRAHIASPAPGLRTSDVKLPPAISFETASEGYGFGSSAGSRRALFETGSFSEKLSVEDSTGDTIFSSSLVTGKDYDD